MFTLQLFSRLFLLLGILIFMPLLDTPLVLAVQAQDKCAAELAEAEQNYREGRLDEAINLVNRCLEKSGLTIEESELAYKLLGKAYHAKGLPDEAKKNLRQLLELIPTWRPNPELDTPSFQKLAEEVIKEVEQEQQMKEPLQKNPPPAETREQVPPAKKIGSKKWLWIGGGAAVIAGTVAVIAISGGGEEKGSIKITW